MEVARRIALADPVAIALAAQLSAEARDEHVGTAGPHPHHAIHRVLAGELPIGPIPAEDRAAHDSSDGVHLVVRSARNGDQTLAGAAGREQGEALERGSIVVVGSAALADDPDRGGGA